MEESLLSEGGFTARVSSVLNKDTKQFGKKHMFDRQAETCWNSDEGSPQHVTIEFNAPVIVTSITIRFQGGFAARECSFISNEGRAVELMKFYPNDNSSLQRFTLPQDVTATVSAYRVYKIMFNNSADFYGRITVYSLDILGRT